MAAVEHIGALISVETNKGVYQGKILAVNDADQSITLERPFHNGIPHASTKVTLAAEDMTAVKILKMPGDFAPPSLVSAPRARAVRPPPPRAPSQVSPSNRVYRPQQSSTCAASLTQSSSGTSQTRPVRMDGLGFIAVSQQPISSNRQQQPHTSPYGRKPVSASLSRGPTVKGSFADRGPCGIPQLDAMEPVRVSSRNKDLGDALDRDLMQTDFDFEANLALFDKDLHCNASDDGMDGVPVKSKNFRHDENIVGDPRRVYSWTSNGRSNTGIELVTNCVLSTTQMTTVDGASMPAVSAVDKVRLLAEAEQQFGLDVLVAIVADRLSQCVFEEIEQSSVMVSKAVVLVSGNGVASGIAARVATHLANRRCDTVVYGFNGNIPVSHTSVRFAHSAGHMPAAQEVQLVVSVCDWTKLGQRLNVPHWLRTWLSSLSTDACVLSLESAVPLSNSQPPRHVMVMVGAPTDGTEQGDGAMVVDIGLPFDMIDQGDALAAAFGTKFVVQLC